MKKINILILVVLVFVGFSCKPKYEKQYNWAYPVAGEWKVNAYVNGVLAGGPYEIKSYNSSMGRDSIWIDDAIATTPYYSFYYFKAKAAVDMSSKTFSTVGSTNAYSDYPISVKVANGKVIGNDSITMDVVFGDDPTTTYKLAGHREVSYDDYTQQ